MNQSLSKRVAGVDLAGVEKRPTGICLLHPNLEAQALIKHGDEEILETVKAFKPSLVGVDAPLNLPAEGGLRPCDRELISRGIRVLPPILGGMRQLTLRAMRLKQAMEAENLKVIECFPGAVRAVFKLPAKRRLPQTIKALEGLGLKIRETERLSLHEVDAILAALTARLSLEGLAETIGSPKTGEIVIPRPEALQWLTRNL